MSSRLLSFSLCLNLALLGVAGCLAVRNYRGNPPAIAPTFQTNRATRENPDLVSTEPTVSTAPASLRWRDLESADYPTYIANLRKAGCPEPVLRRIIGADLRELYARKAFALAKEFHNQFWEIAARENVRNHFKKTLQQKVNAVCKEPDALLRQLVGASSGESTTAPTISPPENRLMSFLSSDKQEQLHRLADRYEAQRQEVLQSDFSSEEKVVQLARLQRDMESRQAEILSPEELAEYRLRQSSAANEVQQLYGVDFSRTELRNLARAIDDYHRQLKKQAETDSTVDAETLDQKLEAMLGPERFADFNRARSASFREIYDVTTNFGLPGATAAEVFDLRLQSEKQSNEIRADKNRPAEEKQALLDALQERVEQTVLAKFGTAAYQSYKFTDGRWINSLGRL